MALQAEFAESQVNPAETAPRSASGRLLATPVPCLATGFERMAASSCILYEGMLLHGSYHILVMYLSGRVALLAGVLWGVSMLHRPSARAIVYFLAPVTYLYALMGAVAVINVLSAYPNDKIVVETCLAVPSAAAFAILATVRIWKLANRQSDLSTN